MHGKQAKISILLISGRAINTPYATQLWVLHENSELAEPQIWKASSKPTNSWKLFMIKMVPDQEDPKEWHLDTQEMTAKMKGIKYSLYLACTLAGLNCRSKNSGIQNHGTIEWFRYVYSPGNPLLQPLKAGLTSSYIFEVIY